MGSVIVLEGCDKTGKSSLAAILAKGLGWKVVASGQPRTADPVAEYLAVLEDPAPLILDRFHLGELVYGPRYRGTATSPFGLAAVEARLEARGALLVHLTDTPAAIRARFRQHGETFAREADVEALVADFHRVVRWSRLPTVTCLYDAADPETQAQDLAARVSMLEPAAAVGPTVLIAETGAALYHQVLARLLEGGTAIAPRGLPTRELAPAWLTLTDPRASVIATPARKLVQRYAAAEFAWIMAGERRLDGIEVYNRHLVPFADQDADGRGFFGAYGPKIAGQLDHVLAALQRDTATRQAVLTIWRENPPATRDVPCTIACQYLLRDGRLSAWTMMRSNDAWLGFPYDLQLFTRLQIYLANTLGVALGAYHHTVGSLHLYDGQREWAEAVIATPPVAGRPLHAFAPIAARDTIWHARGSARYLERLDEWGAIARHLG